MVVQAVAVLVMILDQAPAELGILQSQRLVKEIMAVLVRYLMCQVVHIQV